jgi:hypothetical protein
MFARIRYSLDTVDKPEASYQGKMARYVIRLGGDAMHRGLIPGVLEAVDT